MQGNAEEAVPSQVPLSTKRTRTRTKVTRGMVKEWDMMAGKGMPHREIATMYGVSLVTVDRHLADVNRRQAVKTMKSPVCLTVPTDDAVIKQDLSIKKIILVMSRKISQTSAPSTIKARAGIGPGGVRGSYEGTVSSFWKIGGPVVGITVAVGLIVLPKIRKKLVKVKIGNEILKSELKKDEARENSRIKRTRRNSSATLISGKQKGLAR